MPTTPEPERASGVVSLPIASIVEPARDRRIRATADSDAELDQMIDSLKAHGLLHPIGVRPAAGGTFELVYGSRRLAAARWMGWSTIRCTVHLDLDDQAASSDALCENLHRKDLSPRERAAALRQLARLHQPGTQLGGHSTGGHAAIQPPPRQENSSAGWARKLGVDVSTVSRLAALGHNEPLLELVEGGDLGLTAASHLARLPAELRDGALQQVLHERLSANKTHQLVNRLLRDRKGTTSGASDSSSPAPSAAASASAGGLGLHRLRVVLGLLAGVGCLESDQERAVLEQIAEHVERLRAA
jgi:ParB-like chromosome segregation protein Spo0J